MIDYKERKYNNVSISLVIYISNFHNAANYHKIDEICKNFQLPSSIFSSFLIAEGHHITLR
jgi:hypothetical protein